MKRIKTNISIISNEGGDFGYFMELEDLYSKLTGVKDPIENMEFIEIGKEIKLNNQVLEVLDINLKFDGIDKNISHQEKRSGLMPSNIIVEIFITVKHVRYL